jgi:hypothetical protein
MILAAPIAPIGGKDQQAADLLKVMAAIAFWTGRDLDQKAASADLKTWYGNLDDFLAEIRMTKPVQKALTALIGMFTAGQPPTDEADEYMSTVGGWLAIADKRLEAMTEISRFNLTGIRRAAQYFRNASKGSYEWLHKNAAKISPSFRQEVVDEGLDSQLTDVRSLVELIEKLTGRRDIKLTELEKEKLRETHPEEYRMILDFRRNILAISKQYIRMAVRKAGGLIGYNQLRDQMREDYVFNDLPATEGWDGYIDEDGKLWTKEKKEIKGKPGFTIVGNPEYNPKTDDTYVFSVNTSMGNTQYFYTVEALQGWRKDRFEAVDDFVPMVEKVREKWLHELKAGQYKTRLLATLCELLYWSSGRIGDVKNNVRGEQTYGISTLRGRNVERQGNNLVLDYIGKTGVHQRHVLTPKTPEQKQVARQVLEWAKDAGEDGYVFDLVEGRHSTPPTNGTVNSYFKSKGVPAGVTIHKLRHARAAGIMDRLMRDKRQCPYFRYKGDTRELIAARKPSQQEAEQAYKDLAEEVGRELGHTAGEKVTPMTAINNYIPPATTLQFFNDVQVRVPSWAEKLKDV